MHLLLQHALTVAAGEIGTKEIGYSNTGKKVEEYQDATTLSGTGWAWCAAFIAWVFLQACKIAKVKNFWKNSASCDEILIWARKRNLIRSAPKPGMVGLVMKSNGDATHIFLVEAVARDGDLTTIEGNTNLKASRNGDGVYRLKTRNANQTRSTDGGPKYLFIDVERILPDVQAKTPGYSLFLKNAQGALRQVMKTNGQPLVMPLLENQSYVPLPLWAAYMGFGLDWDNEDQVAFFIQKDGQRREVLGTLAKFDIDGDGSLEPCAPIRAVVEAGGLALEVDTKTRRVIVYRPAQKG